MRAGGIGRSFDKICSTCDAFAAVVKDGTLVAWGDQIDEVHLRACRRL